MNIYFIFLLINISIILYFVYYIVKNYKKRENFQILDDKYFFIHLKNVFDDKDYEYIKKNTNNKNLSKDKYADNYSKYIYDKKINELIFSKTASILKNIQKIKKSNVLTEYRIYHNKSTGMKWHTDILMSDPPQYEVVFVVSNTSDSKTQIKLKNGKIKDIISEGNDIIIVKGDGIKHRVTPITNRGTRSIIKAAFLPKKSKEIDQNVNFQNNKY